MAKAHESKALEMERKLIINAIESIYNYARALTREMVDSFTHRYEKLNVLESMFKGKLKNLMLKIRFN